MGNCLGIAKHDIWKVTSPFDSSWIGFQRIGKCLCVTEEEHVNKTTQCLVLSISLPRLKNIWLLPFCTYALWCNSMVTLPWCMEKASWKEEWGGVASTSTAGLPSSGFTFTCACTQTCRGTKPLKEATKDTAVLWLILWCVPTMVLVWQKGQESSWQQSLGKGSC